MFKLENIVVMNGTIYFKLKQDSTVGFQFKWLHLTRVFCTFMRSTKVYLLNSGRRMIIGLVITHLKKSRVTIKRNVKLLSSLTV